MSDKEEVIEFPCVFPVKIMGANDPQFVEHSCALVGQHTGLIDAAAVSTRQSKSGKYLSVTITINAQSRQQLDAIYQALTDDEQVVMAL